MHNFDGKNLLQGCSSWGLGSFLIYIFYEKNSILDFNRKYIWFHLLELIFDVFSCSAVAHFLSCSLHQLSCCGIFICYTSYFAVATFFYYIYRVSYYTS